MLTSTATITLNQIGIICNIVGLAIPALMALAVVRFHRVSYFKNWTTYYLSVFTGLSLNLFSDSLGHPLYLSMPIAALHGIGTLFLYRTSFSLRSASPPSWLVGGVTGLLLVSAETLLVLGVPFDKAVLMTLLVNLAGYGALGWTLMRLAVESDIRRFLAITCFGIGAWDLTYPVTTSMHIEWCGYIVAGMLHLILGVGMAMFAFELNALRLAEQNQQLKQLDRLKTNFISTVSHELRTPITAIKSAAWLIDRPRTAPTATELKQVIDQQTDVLTRIVTDMLDASLIESGAMTYQKQPVCLIDVAEQAVHGVRPLFEEKGLTLTLEAPDDMAALPIDADRLQQVLTNLLINALKFTPAGGRVVVRVAREESHGRLEVADTGIGLAPEEHAKVFERFYQVDNTSTRKVGGAGLGLAIARAIVEEGHQGKIWVESTPGQGSTFVVTLPLKPQGALASASGGAR